MKKVLIISNMYPTKEHLSYGIFVKNQVDQLNAAGVETVIAINDNPATGKKNVLKKYAKWALQVWSTFRQQKHNISLTHAHYVFPSGMFSYWLKKRYKIPYIVTAHGGDLNKMAKKSARIHSYTTKILQYADHVITVGEELATMVENDYNIPKERISVMSMGIDRTLFQKMDKQQAKQRIGMDMNHIHFLFVGNIIREKGVEELIQAFQALEIKYTNQISLHCIGSTKDQYFTNIIQSQLTSANIHLIEPMPQTDLVRYFQAADFFILPSYMEGLGLVALEAMSCGTPVIASDVGGLHYMLQNDVGLPVPPKNKQALEQAMEQAVKGFNINEIEQERLLQIHDAERIIERVTELYKKVAK